MDLANDARRALPGVWDLFLGRREGLRRFDLSVVGFWRVFWFALGALSLVEVTLVAVGAEHPLVAAGEAAITAVAVLGGSAAAIQVVLAVGALEDWEGRALRFLVPLLWIGVALWGTVAAWRLAAAGLGVEHAFSPAVAFALGALTFYTAWQAARLGLNLKVGQALGVIFVYALAQFAGYVIVRSALLLLP